MPPLDQLIQSIDARIEELKSEMASLQAARSALVANGAGPAPSSAATARPAAPRRRSKTKKPLTAEAAEQLLATSDGLTTAALAQRADAGRDQVLALLRDLETARRVRRTGQRRGTRWHAITDEDRVRERAAELASRGENRGARG
jgi:DNA-binding CsgD family transcriptional regulator